MDINGTHRFAANRQAVWDALHNSALVTKCIPGAESVTWQGDSAVSARVTIGVGPITGTYVGTAQVTQQQAPSLLKLAINRNLIQAEATINLSDDGAGTIVAYAATAKLNGTLAIADNPITKQMAQGALGQFFKQFEQQLA
jgi:carbon monoxide dehydrogenase subunit G